MSSISHAVPRAFSQSAVLISSAEAEAFFDGVISAQLEAAHMPGAAVSVVQNGKLAFAKGYGYANVEQRIPVTVDKTLFRLASVSKLFVWTAVMQLVEDGKLDLNADVNRYLKDFQIPATYSKPITLLDLMNHTPGFEERSLGTSARSTQDLQPLSKYLAEHIPARVRPPGELTAYSNYGAALAGYIVSQVTGMPFEQYVEEHIFKPLAMQHSTFRQPLPADLAPNLATGYTYANGAFESQTTEWAQLAPAAAISATASDMANFMIAQLQNGRFADQRIMKETTAQEMHRQSFSNDPLVNGYAHGFSIATINNQRLIWHGGDFLNFHSALVLLPEQNTGLFVVFNSANGMLPVLNTLRAFIDHYYPTQQPNPSAPDGRNDPLELYAGTFLPARNEYTTAGKLVGLFQSISVAPASDHQLVVSLGFPSQITWKYIEISPNVFRSTDSPPSIFGDLVFQSDARSHVQYMFQQNNPTTAYIKAPFYAGGLFNIILLAICMLLFISVIVWAPIGLWLSRRFQRPLPFWARFAAWWQGLLSLLILLFLFGFVAVFSNAQTVYGLPAWARFLFMLPVFVAILTAGMLVLSILAWLREFWSLPGRIHYTLVTLAGLAFTAWLAYWNLWIIHLY